VTSVARVDGFVLNAAFWEATFMPLVLVSLVAFSACMDCWLTRVISLTVWYWANLTMLSHGVNALHPDSLENPLAKRSPFGSTSRCCAWSLGIALLEVLVSLPLGYPRVGRALGTVLHGVSVAVVHCIIVPWPILPHYCIWLRRLPSYLGANRLHDFHPMWHPRIGCHAVRSAPQVFKAVSSVARLGNWDISSRTKASYSKPTLPVVPVDRPSIPGDTGNVEHTPTCAGHIALLLAAYAMLVSLQCPEGQIAVAQPGNSSVVSVVSVVSVPSRSGDRPSLRRLEELTSSGWAMNSVRPADFVEDVDFVVGSAQETAEPSDQPPQVFPLQNASVELSKTGRDSLRLHPILGAGEELRANPKSQARQSLEHEVLGSSGAAGERSNEETMSREQSSRAALRKLSPPSALKSKEPSNPETTPNNRSSSPRELAAPAAASRFTSKVGALQWGGLLVAGGFAALSLYLSDHGKSFEFSIPYLVFYNLLLVRVPDILGHTLIAFLDDLHRYTSETIATTLLSLAYMLSMQIFMYLVQWVCWNMSAMHLYPRFFFMGQMYYYLFWYMMLMVVSTSGLEDVRFWVLVAMLNGTSALSNINLGRHLFSMALRRASLSELPLKTVFDSKLSTQDQLADMISLLIVPSIATSYHVFSALRSSNFPGKALASLWYRFGTLLIARLFSGWMTEQVYRRRLRVLSEADEMELQLVPLDPSPNRLRYLNDICASPKFVKEAIRNIERCQLYFTAVAVACTFSVFQRANMPVRYAFIAFGS